MPDRRHTRAGLSLLLAMATLAAVALAACDLFDDSEGGNGGATPDVSPSPEVAPEEALRLFVQRRLNQEFVTPCEDAQRPDDVGKQCARFRGERDGMLAYELGPTFGEFTRLIILQRAGEGWTIVHQETRDPNLPPVPGIPWPLRPGADVIVAGTGDCLRVRERPGLEAPEITCLDDGTPVTIASMPVDIDGFEWWQLEGYDGWVASNWLRYPEEAPTPEPTAAPEG